jgi:hypothetical protein
MREENQSQEGHVMAPLSPYSSNRALLRDLTLPTVPNYNIPPSPPGSPMESTNAKFKHFLELKKQGIHFNDKLSKSSAMKNPALMQKLLDFSDINEANTQQPSHTSCGIRPHIRTMLIRRNLPKASRRFSKRKKTRRAEVNERVLISFTLPHLANQ